MHHIKLDKQEKRIAREKESTATSHHIVNYPIFCAIRKDLYGNVFSYPAALSRVARIHKINDRHHHPLVESTLTSRRTSTLFWYEAHSHTYTNRKPHSHNSTVKHTQPKCVYREMRRLNKLPSLVQFVISCVLCAAQGAVAAIYPADIFFLALLCCYKNKSILQYYFCIIAQSEN